MYPRRVIFPREAWEASEGFLKAAEEAQNAKAHIFEATTLMFLSKKEP